MAAQEKDTDNPFSFKAFISKRENRDDETTGGGKKKTDGGGRRKKVSKKEKKTESVLASPFPEVDRLGGGGGGGQAGEDNPFSFKKFVKKQGNQPAKTISSRQHKHLSDSFSSDDEAEDTSGPLMPPSNPPLLVDPLRTRQDSLSLSSSDGESVPLPALEQIIPSTGPLVTSQPNIDPLGGRVTSSESSDDERGGLVGPPVVGDLLDDTDRQLLAEVNKLRKDKEEVMQKLQKSDKLLSKEQRKCQSLRDEIKRLKEKEAADTKALEEIVQKVEKNLIVTTERAVKAESTIVKLQQEIKSLQIQLAKASPQAVHQHYEEVLAGVREKAAFASRQLNSAAHKADLQIKELLLGVDTLKTVSEVLLFVDRVTEVKNK